MLSGMIIVASLLIAPGDALAQPDAGQATAPAELATQVRRFMRSLNSEALAERTEAEQALIKLGHSALDLLPADSPQMPAEVRERLGRVRLALQAAAAKAAVLASRVTLSAKQTPISQVFATITQQTGNKFADFRAQFGQEETDTKIDIDLKDAPYWQALDKVLDAAELTIYPFGGTPGATSYVARPPEAASRTASVAYQGVFRLAAENLSAVRDLRNPQSGRLTLQLGISWEPRVLPITLQQPLDKIEAVDEQGRKMEVSNERGTLEIPIEGSVAGTELELPFKLPPRDALRIASLQGTLLALVPGRQEAFRFDKLADARDVEQRKAGVTVLLQDFRKNGDIYEARIVVRFDQASGALESHRGWIFKNPAYLLNRAGEKVEYAGFETTRQGPTEIGLSYKFVIEADQLANHQFVYETPSALLKIPIDYELKDLPLP